MRASVINGLLCLALATCTSLSRGCCSAKLPEPAHPGPVEGWKESHVGGIDAVGMLVLTKGESSDNGKVGIRVVDIIAGDPCASYGTLQSITRVKLQFYQPAQQSVICEDTFNAGSGASLIAGPCGPRIADFGISAISINAINASEGWVWFDLRK